MVLKMTHNCFQFVYFPGFKRERKKWLFMLTSENVMSHTFWQWQSNIHTHANVCVCVCVCALVCWKSCRTSEGSKMLYSVISCAQQTPQRAAQTKTHTHTHGRAQTHTIICTRTCCISPIHTCTRTHRVQGSWAAWGHDRGRRHSCVLWLELLSLCLLRESGLKCGNIDSHV